jgi:UrcA family protein
MKSIKFLLPVAALVFSSLAAAGEPDTRSVVVRFSDLNLHSSEGVAGLHKRIRNAAQSVCSDLDNRTLALRATYEKCVDEAVTNAVAEVGSSKLAVLASSR